MARGKSGSDRKSGVGVGAVLLFVVCAAPFDNGYTCCFRERGGRGGGGTFAKGGGGAAAEFVLALCTM